MRNYIEEPLKRGELIPFDDLYEIYINQNRSIKDACVIFNIKVNRIYRNLKFYKIKKSIEDRQKVIQQTLIQKYGVDNVSKLEEVKNKKQNTFLNHYGVKCSLQDESVKNKGKETCLKRYGKEYASQTEEFKDKVKQTCIEKYGTTNYSSTEECRNKVIKTYKEKYNAENPMYIESIRQKVINTNIEKYGETRATKLKEFKDKAKQTSIEKYGVEYFTQSNYFDKDAMSRKSYNTKKKNHTFNTSKNEEQILELLNKDLIVYTQYKSDKYPFACDFYLPELDLYIEYQGHISHGEHPFNENDINDINQVNEWKQKYNELNFKGKKKKAYLNYIETWTKRDPYKRQIAKENNLNLIEFFNMKEFIQWYENIKKEV